MAKVWQIAPHFSDDLIEQLLSNRGIKNPEEKEKFFHPKLSDFKQDLKITGITKANKRIEKAIKNNELIVVFGDYDVDGLCGAAIFYLGLTSIGAKVLPYIPHREKEGYGLNKLGLDYANEQGASLVITVDNGIVAVKAAEYAKKLGLDLIITDHHVSKEEKPEALAIVHSIRMSGTGVGWCLVRTLMGEKESAELLDLVALATIGDLSSLLGVNRALTKIGLQKLNQTTRVGLLALIRQSGLRLGEIDSYTVGHILAPRLNAKGRLEYALDTLRLLCTKDKQKAASLAGMLGDSNEQKKQLVAEAIFQAKELIGINQKKIVVVSSNKWIPGIVGLIAGRISEEYRTPAVVISEDKEVSKGSARSVNGVNIVETIRQFSDLLIDIGGHPGAAGFTIETTKIAIFKTRLEEVMEKTPVDQTDKLLIEAVLPVSKINKKIIGEIDRFEPTGVGNPKPILASYNLKLSNLRTVGNGHHLKGLAEGIEMIAFGQGDLMSLIPNNQPVNLAYYLELDRYNGEEKLQLKILDIKITG